MKKTSAPSAGNAAQSPGDSQLEIQLAAQASKTHRWQLQQNSKNDELFRKIFGTKLDIDTGRLIPSRAAATPGDPA